jgi:hypothetical protein
MSQGRPSKWALATLNEPIGIGKSGISIVIWDKWGRKRRGKMVVSVGGVRWYPYKAKRATRLTWTRFSELIEEHGRLA